MKIREKLFIGFGFYILFASILGFFAYKELRTITKRLAFVEMADDITNVILEVRRYEKNFLLFKDKDNLDELRKYCGKLEKNIGNIKTEITKKIGKDNYDRMKKEIEEYGRTVNGIADNFRYQDKLAGDVRYLGREIEQRLTGRELRTFLVLRRHEKNLMLYKNRAAYDIFAKTYDSLDPIGLAEIRNYRSLVDRLFGLYKEEADIVGMMRTKAREIQSFTEDLSKRERMEIDSILRKSTNLLLYALLTVILLGVAINIKLASSIASPIRTLEKITKKIAMGDFSEHVEVKGRDEITSLEISFNQMEDKLKDALNSLEEALVRLQMKQAQLVEAEKLASVGKFAAGVAHEINNPLTSVLTFSNLMLEQMREDDLNRERVKMMAKETMRARNIVKQLLDFAKDIPIRPVKININKPVSEIIESLVAQEAFKDIELSLALSDNLPDIYADPARIGQVVLNLMLNAIHSITPPGKIAVSTTAASDYVEIIFSDTGCGIPDENLNRIFDPFFTTKDSSKGTGLGLAVSYGIIKKHGGDIEVKSIVGKGSSFIIRLPLNVK